MTVDDVVWACRLLARLSDEQWKAAFAAGGYPPDQAARFIAKLKSKFKKEMNIIGFLSHIQGELKVKAQEAGCDMVLPRSAFSQNLPQLLRRHATSEAELQEY